MLDLLVCLSHVVFVLALDVQVELTAAHLGLLPWLHKYTTKGDVAIGLILDSMKETLVTGLLPSPEWVIVDFEVIREEICTLGGGLVLEGTD